MLKIKVGDRVRLFPTIPALQATGEVTSVNHREATCLVQVDEVYLDHKLVSPNGILLVDIHDEHNPLLEVL